MANIQNKQQNLKTQIKPEKPEDLKRELKVVSWPAPQAHWLAPLREDLKRELKVIKSWHVTLRIMGGRSQKRIEGFEIL